jgi:SAM-dependent methyltransferase
MPDQAGEGPVRYTHGHPDAVLRSHRWRTVENSAPHLLPLLEPGMDVLDVGCGPGTITLDLAARVAPGRTVGLDPAPAAIDEARRRAVEQGDTTTELLVGDVFALDRPDDSFDVVHAHQVLQHLGDPVAALREMRRVCRPGGVVAVRDADYAAMCWAPASEGLDAWLALYRSVARGNGGEPDAGRHLLAWAHAAGFSDVTCSASAWCFASPEDRAWWSETWAERTTASPLAEQAISQGLATEADLAAMGDAWREWAAHPDAWFSVLHGELLARP